MQDASGKIAAAPELCCSYCCSVVFVVVFAVLAILLVLRNEYFGCL